MLATSFLAFAVGQRAWQSCSLEIQQAEDATQALGRQHCGNRSQILTGKYPPVCLHFHHQSLYTYRVMLGYMLHRLNVSSSAGGDERVEQQIEDQKIGLHLNIVKSATAISRRRAVWRKANICLATRDFLGHWARINLDMPTDWLLALLNHCFQLRFQATPASSTRKQRYEAYAIPEQSALLDPL